jgi:hypothetical protein
MSDYPRPAGLDAFALCAQDGCRNRVYAPRCKACGGSGAMPEIPATDPYGESTRAAAAVPSPAASRPA